MNILKQIHELTDQLEMKQKAKAISILGLGLLEDTKSPSIQFTLNESQHNATIKCTFELVEGEGEEDDS